MKTAGVDWLNRWVETDVEAVQRAVDTSVPVSANLSPFAEGKAQVSALDVVNGILASAGFSAAEPVYSRSGKLIRFKVRRHS